MEGKANGGMGHTLPFFRTSTIKFTLGREQSGSALEQALGAAFLFSHTYIF